MVRTRASVRLLALLSDDNLAHVLSFLQPDLACAAVPTCTSFAAQLAAAVRIRAARHGLTLPTLLPGETIAAALSYLEATNNVPGVRVLRRWPRPLVVRVSGCVLPGMDDEANAWSAHCNGDFVETGRRNNRCFFTRVGGVGILFSAPRVATSWLDGFGGWKICRAGGWATDEGSGYGGWNFSQRSAASCLPPLGNWLAEKSDAEMKVPYGDSWFELVPYDDSIHSRPKPSELRRWRKRRSRLTNVGSVEQEEVLLG